MSIYQDSDVCWGSWCKCAVITKMSPGFSIRAEARCAGVFVLSCFWLLLFLLPQFTNLWRVPFNIRLSRCFSAGLLVREMLAEEEKCQDNGKHVGVHICPRTFQWMPSPSLLLGKCPFIFFTLGSKTSSFLCPLPYTTCCLQVTVLLMELSSKAETIFLLSFPWCPAQCLAQRKHRYTFVSKENHYLSHPRSQGKGKWSCFCVR